MRDNGGEAGRLVGREAASYGGASVPARIAALLRRVAGMPDYDAHVDHLRKRHPATPIPTRRQFYEEFIGSRYADGPTRCC
jgi:uncharacterized short protein YbdD (DUF466 family)